MNQMMSQTATTLMVWMTTSTRRKWPRKELQQITIRWIPSNFSQLMEELGTKERTEEHASGRRWDLTSILQKDQGHQFPKSLKVEMYIGNLIILGAIRSLRVHYLTRVMRIARFHVTTLIGMIAYY